MHASAIQSGQLGFRCPVTARSGDTAGKFTASPTSRRQGGFQRGRILIFDYSTTVSVPVVVSIVATVARVRIPRSTPVRTVGSATVVAVSGVRSA